MRAAYDLSGNGPSSHVVSRSMDTRSIGDGIKVVAAAGTPERLTAGHVYAKWVTIQAQTDNTGFIAVGTDDVDGTEATGDGVLLDNGLSITIPISDLYDVWIDATVSGDGVRFTSGR